jgi:NADPH:quinone reductase-like Zn-dependent oxidoreductase
MTAVVGDRYGSSDVLRVVRVQRPEAGLGEVLVRVHAASINTADLDNLRGRPWPVRFYTGLRRPRRTIPGLDIAGVVETVGPGVGSVAVGDEVWADLFGSGAGGFAEYVCVSEKALLPKPAGVSFDTAATAPHSAILALQALKSRRVSPGDHVLINGGGGCVGPFAIQMARDLGAEVTGVDHSGKLDLMRSVGAHHVVDFTSEDVTRNGRRYDLIVDIAATRSVIAFRRSLTAHGAYVQVARSLAGFFSAALLGALIGGRRRMGVFTWVPNHPEDMARIGKLIASGAVDPVIDRVFPLAETPQAVAHQESGAALGKVVLAVAS